MPNHRTFALFLAISILLPGAGCAERQAIESIFIPLADHYAVLVGVVLTGANGDGSLGLKQIATCGGMTIVQDPETAEAEEMLCAALAATRAGSRAGAGGHRAAAGRAIRSGGVNARIACHTAPRRNRRIERRARSAAL